MEMKQQSVNGHYEPSTPVSHDHLDLLLAAMRQVMLLMGVVPWLMKADIDAAFRRVPLKTQHMWAAGVDFLLGGGHRFLSIMECRSVRQVP